MKLLYCSTILVTATLLTSCQALNNYDRQATVYADVSDKKVGFKYSIWGAKEPGKGTLKADVEIVGSLSDGKQVISIER